MATEKFKALVHFIVNECQDRPSRLGATRLNKALWYADVIAYKIGGTSITGDKYVKRERGPVPKHILATIRELEREGKIKVRQPEFTFDVRKFISLADPDTTLLSDAEKALTREVLLAVCNHTATRISDMTHDIIWGAAKEGEEIPLCATLAGYEGEITEAVLAWADREIAAIEVEAA